MDYPYCFTVDTNQIQEYINYTVWICTGGDFNYQAGFLTYEESKSWKNLVQEQFDRLTPQVKIIGLSPQSD